MAKDLRYYLQLLEKKMPQEFLRASKCEVDPAWEISALVRHLEEEKRFPALILEKVKGSALPVLTNLFASRRRLALALETEERLLTDEYRQREASPIKPVITKTGPVKEKIRLGEQADLRSLPLVTHCEKDVGPYITAGVTLMKDPDTGISNAGIYRIMYKGPRRLGISMDEGSHAYHIFSKMEERRKDLAVAVVLGHHPAFYLGAVAPLSLDRDEMELVGSLLGEPLELVPAETVDLMVPAWAELIIEGRVLAGVREPEAPFGEFTWYYGKEKESPVLEVSAITSRADAIFLDIHSPSVDHVMVQIPGREAELFRRVREVVPTVSQVRVLEEGCFFLTFVQMKKEYDGQARLALLAALSSPLSKIAVVVDEDVNIMDSSEVLWAMATRTQPDRSILMMPESFVCRLDPSGYASSGRNIKGCLNTKLGIDATWPLEFPFPERSQVQGRWKEINLAHYLDP